MDIQIQSLNAGEMSDFVAGRVDVPARGLGGRVVENFLSAPQGPMFNRPGTEYLGAVGGVTSGAVDNAKQTGLIGFTNSEGTSYFVEVSEYLHRFWKNDARVAGSAVNITGVTLGSSNTFDIDQITLASTTNLRGKTVTQVTCRVVSGTMPANGQAVLMKNFTGTGTVNAQLNETVFLAANVTGAAPTGTFTLRTVNNEVYDATGYTTAAVTADGYVNPSPVVLMASNSFKLNDVVYITGITGTTQLNGNYYCVKARTTAGIELASINGNVDALRGDINGTGYTAWSSGGTVQWVGVMHPYPESDLFDSDNVFDLGYEVLGDTIFFAHKNHFPRRMTWSSDSSWWERPSGVVVTTYTPTASYGGLFTQVTAATPPVLTSANLSSFGEWEYVRLANVSANLSPLDGAYLLAKKLTSNTLALYNIDMSDCAQPVATASTTGSVFTCRRDTRNFQDGPYDTNQSSSDGLKQGSAVLIGSEVTIAIRTTTAADPGLPNANNLTGTPRFYEDQAEGCGLIWRDESATAVPMWGVATKYDSAKEMTSTLCSKGNASTDTTQWRLGIWNPRGGYPHRVTFYQDRIVYAGGAQNSLRIDMSESGNYNSFAPTDPEDKAEVLDTSAVTFSIASQDAVKINWIKGSDKGLIVGCAGGVFSISGTDSVVVKPGAVASQIVSSFGANQVKPEVVGASVFFADSSGERIRSTGYTVENDGYEASDMTRLAINTCHPGIIGSCFQKTPYPIIWLVRSDGQLVSLLIDRQEKIQSFARHILGGAFSSGDAVVEQITSAKSNTGAYDEVWMVVKRTIGGTKRYIEKLSDYYFANDDVTQASSIWLDSAVTVSPSGATASGLSHLEGQTVDAVYDGKIATGLTVTSGSVTLPASATTAIIGLPYYPVFESTNLEFISQQGTSLGSIKRLNKADIGFYRTVGCWVGRDSNNMREVDFGKYKNSAVSETTAIKKEIFNGSHASEPRIRIEQRIPAPLCITFLKLEGESYG